MHSTNRAQERGKAAGYAGGPKPLTLTQVMLEPINASFASPLRSRLKNSVDILLFNPPYVPTESEEAYHAQSGMTLPGSWAGGTDGMQVTDLFLPDVPVSLAQFPAITHLLTSLLGSPVSQRQVLPCGSEAE